MAGVLQVQAAVAEKAVCKQSAGAAVPWAASLVNYGSKCGVNGTFWYHLPGVESGVKVMFRRVGDAKWSEYDNNDGVDRQLKCSNGWWCSGGGSGWGAVGDTSYEQSCWVNGACVIQGIFGPPKSDYLPQLPSGTSPPALNDKAKPKVTKTALPAEQAAAEQAATENAPVAEKAVCKQSAGAAVPWAASLVNYGSKCGVNGTFWYHLPGVESGVKVMFRRVGDAKWSEYDNNDGVDRQLKCSNGWWCSGGGSGWGAVGDTSYEQSCWVNGACVIQGIFGPPKSDYLPQLPSGTSPPALNDKAKPKVTKTALPAEQAAAEKAAADKALKEAEDAQLAAAIAASLDVSDPVTAPPPPPTLPTPPPVARVKRWGDGLEAPAAGSRNFVPQGFEVTLDVSDAIARFGHSASHVGQIMDAGRAKASTSPAPLASTHAAALYAYTEESPLYGTLNFTMRTPHTPTTPTDTELKRYGDYIVHTERALSSLPTHVSEILGNVFRGIKVLLSPDIYAPGKRITWQAFSSSTKKQTATLDFVNVLPGRKLSGSLFVIDSITAKDIRHFSAIPGEEEVLFPPNSQFKVEKVVTSEQEKKALLNQLGAYDMTDLDVYVLKQIA